MDNENLKNDLFGRVLSEYHSKIEVNDEILEAYTLRDALPNYHYN